MDGEGQPQGSPITDKVQSFRVPQPAGVSRISDGCRSGQKWWRPRWLAGFDWRVLLALLGTYIFFGSGAAGSKAAIQSLPPLLLVGVRGMIAGVALLAWSVAAGASLPKRRQWLASAVIGILILALGAGCGTVGQKTVASGIAGVLSALVPLFAASLGYVLFREKIPRRAVIGVVVGFAGIAMLLRPGSDLDLFGVALIAGGQVAWALGAILSPQLGLPDDPRLAAGAELLTGGALLTIAAAALGDFGQLHLGSVSSTSWMGFAWLICTAIGGFTAYGFLAKTVSCSIATTFSYVNPVVAVTLGAILFAEPITTRAVVSTVVIILGVFLIVSARTEEAPRPRHPMTSGHGHPVRVRPRPSRPAAQS